MHEERSWKARAQPSATAACTRPRALRAVDERRVRAVRCTGGRELCYLALQSRSLAVSHGAWCAPCPIVTTVEPSCLARETLNPTAELQFSWSAREYFARARSLKPHQSPRGLAILPHARAIVSLDTGPAQLPPPPA